MCDEMEATYVPAGLSPTGVERVYEDPPPGEDPRFVASVLTFQDEAGERQLVLSSGVAEMVGEFQEVEESDVEVRGHPADVTEAPGSHVAVWFEDDLGEPCAQYAVVGVQIPKEEFDKVLEGIR
jgi:hypothetical protein